MTERKGFFNKLFRRRAAPKRLERLRELDVKLRSEGSRRERLRSAGSLAMVVVALVAVVFGLKSGVNWVARQMMQDNPSFTIERVKVEGCRMLGEDVVRGWAGVAAGRNLFDVDAARVKRDLELVPFIKSASVERVLPRTLKLTIVERTPVARICIFRPAVPGGAVHTANLFLDSQGYVMPASGPFSEVSGAANQSMLSALPVLTGIEASKLHGGARVDSPQAVAALKLLEDFWSTPLAKRLSILSIDVSQKRTMLLSTSDGALTTAGLAGFQQQLARWQAVLEWASRNSKSPASIDLAAGVRLPVRWKDPAPEVRPGPDTNTKPTNPKHV